MKGGYTLESYRSILVWREKLSMKSRVPQLWICWYNDGGIFVVRPSRLRG